MNKINFSELTLNNFSQWPVFLKYFLLTILTIFLSLLYYGLILKPDFSRYTELLNQEINLRSEFESKQQLANLNAYHKQLQMVNKEYETKLKQLTTENEIANLLAEISRTGAAFGLSFELFAPQAEKINDFYIALAIHIIVIGEYQQLALFLSHLAQFNHLITLHDFEILQAIPNKNQASYNLKLNDLLQMKITAKIYRYR